MRKVGIGKTGENKEGLPQFSQHFQRALLVRRFRGWEFYKNINLINECTASSLIFRDFWINKFCNLIVQLYHFLSDPRTVVILT